MRNLHKNSSGATAVEYALIAALIAVVIIVGVRMVSSQMTNQYDLISSSIDGVM